MDGDKGGQGLGMWIGVDCSWGGETNIREHPPLPQTGQGIAPALRGRDTGLTTHTRQRIFQPLALCQAIQAVALAATLAVVQPLHPSSSPLKMYLMLVQHLSTPAVLPQKDPRSHALWQPCPGSAPSPTPRGRTGQALEVSGDIRNGNRLNRCTISGHPQTRVTSEVIWQPRYLVASLRSGK